jgi:hypothetical protein
MEASIQLHDPIAFFSEEEAPGMHCIGGWMGPVAGLNAVEKKKILPLPESTSSSSLVQPIA